MIADLVSQCDFFTRQSRCRSRDLADLQIRISGQRRCLDRTEEFIGFGITGRVVFKHLSVNVNVNGDSKPSGSALAIRQSKHHFVMLGDRRFNTCWSEVGGVDDRGVNRFQNLTVLIDAVQANVAVIRAAAGIALIDVVPSDFHFRSGLQGQLRFASRDQSQVCGDEIRVRGQCGRDRGTRHRVVGFGRAVTVQFKDLAIHVRHHDDSEDSGTARPIGQVERIPLFERRMIHIGDFERGVHRDHSRADDFEHIPCGIDSFHSHIVVVGVGGGGTQVAVGPFDRHQHSGLELQDFGIGGSQRNLRRHQIRVRSQRDGERIAVGRVIRLGIFGNLNVEFADVRVRVGGDRDLQIAHARIAIGQFERVRASM